MGGIAAARYKTSDLDHVHRMMHEGRYFIHTGEISLAAAGVYDHLLEVPASGCYPHLRLIGIESTVAPVRIWLYENPTVTDTGPQHASVNVKRYSTRSPGLLVSHQPVTTDPGTLVLDRHIVTGTLQSGGSGAQSFMEFLLAPGARYLVRLQNNSPQTAAIVFAFEHYEEEHAEEDR